MPRGPKQYSHGRTTAYSTASRATAKPTELMGDQDNHLIPNLPLLLSSRNTSDWGARKDWALPDSASSTYLPDNVGASHEGGIQGESSISRPSRPNLKALRVYAKHILPVAHTTKREFSEFERTERELGEVLDIWETQIGMSMTGGLGDGEDDNLVNCKSKELQDHGHGYGEGAEAGLYVKDWHLLDTLEKEGRGAGEIYEVPDCLRGESYAPCFDESASYRTSYGPSGTRKTMRIVMRC